MRWLDEVVEEGRVPRILKCELAPGLSRNRSQAEVSKGITDLSKKRDTKVLEKTLKFYVN